MKNTKCDEKNTPNSFDLYRLIAALGVMLSHSETAFWGIPEELGKSLKYTSLGDIGVYVFFSISGYLICSSLLKFGSFKNFTLRRAARIFPGLVICVFFCLVLGVFFTDLPVYNYIKSDLFLQFILNVFIFPFHNIPTTGLCSSPFGCNLVGPFWTLSYEVLAYLALTIIFFAFRDPRHILMICIVIVLILFGIQIESFINSTHVISLSIRGIEAFHIDTRSFSLLLGIFFVGATVKLFRSHFLVRWPISLVIIAVYMCQSLGTDLTAALLNMIAIPIIVISFANNPTKITHLLDKKVGDISYGIYLYHMPILVVVWITLYHHFKGYSVIFAYLITFFIAWVSYKFIEHPMILWAKQKN